MKTTPLILATTWIATLVVAFIIGSKLNPSEDEKTADRSENHEGNGPSPRSTSRNRNPAAAEWGISLAASVAMDWTIMDNNNISEELRKSILPPRESRH